MFSLTRLLLIVLAFGACSYSLAQETKATSTEAKQSENNSKLQLPESPPGYVWRIFKNALLPKPEKWHEHETSTKFAGILPMEVYASSPEIFSETKQFETGVTVEIIEGSKKILKFEASRMPLVLLKPIFDSHKKDDILTFNQKSQGDFHLTFFRFRDAPPKLKPIIVHKFFIASDSTDSVHIFTFESPEELWNDNWEKYGKTILSKVSILQSTSPK